MKWLIIFLLLIPLIQAETTFFDNTDDAIVIGELPVSEGGSGKITITENIKKNIICGEIIMFITNKSIEVYDIKKEDFKVILDKVNKRLFPNIEEDELKLFFDMDICELKEKKVIPKIFPIIILILFFILIYIIFMKFKK